jgi:alpha-L-fucosidase
MHNPIPQFVHFGKSYEARYFRLEPTTEINSRNICSVAEVGILTE